MAEVTVLTDPASSPSAAPPASPPVVPSELSNSLDHDQLALQDAQRAAAAEETGQGAPGAGVEPPAPAEPPRAPASPSEPLGKPGQVMIPKERFDEVRGDRDKFRDEANYLAGQLDALRNTMGKDQPQGATPEAAADAPTAPKTLAEVKAEIRATRVANQKAYDDAEITGAQFAERQATLDELLLDTVAAISSQTHQPAPAAQTSLVDETIQDQHVSGLEQRHPYLTALGADKLGVLRAMVDAEWKAEGRHAQFKNPIKRDMAFREDMARLSDVKGPGWLPDFVPPKPVTTTPPAAPAPLSAAAQARKDKLAFAAAGPPDLTQVGKPGDVVEWTEADIMKLTTLQLENLPKSVTQRFLQ